MEKKYLMTVGKIRFWIESRSPRLLAEIENRFIYIGGVSNEGYFRSVEEAEKYIENNEEVFLKCNSMRTLIYL